MHEGTFRRQGSGKNAPARSTVVGGGVVLPVASVVRLAAGGQSGRGWQRIVALDGRRQEECPHGRGKDRDDCIVLSTVTWSENKHFPRACMNLKFNENGLGSKELVAFIMFTSLRSARLILKICMPLCT